MLKLLLAALLPTLLLTALPRPACAADAVLAPAGVLRAAYIVTNLAQARRDPVTGRITGVSADVAREIARRAGAELEILPLASAAAVLEAVRTNQAEIGFVAPNPARTGLVLYSRPYMLVQQSALVRQDSLLSSVRELDRPGHAIGVNKDDSVGVWLRERLTEARLRESPDYTLREAAAWLQDGTIVAFAGNRQRLREGTSDVPGLRLLDDNLYGVPQTVAVPPGDEARLAQVEAILSDLRTTGFLAASVIASGVDGIGVAP